MDVLYSRCITTEQRAVEVASTADLLHSSNSWLGGCTRCENPFFMTSHQKGGRCHQSLSNVIA